MQLNPLTGQELPLAPPSPLILTRAEHSISRKQIHPNALKVLYRLASLGYKSYLVGGGVRDLLLQKEPKDYDVATDAKPSRLKKVFRNCRIIGRRFRIAHVYFPDGDIVEVSTFRRSGGEIPRTEKGMIISDNEYGTPEEDARRRDITINGLFYDIQNFSVIDYVGGVRDLRDRIIRTITDPDVSFREDPVRMIRVQRHAARTGFEIEPGTLRAVFQNRMDIRNANTARLLEEILKDLRGGAARTFFGLLMETHLFDCLLPQLSEQLRGHGPDHPFWRRMKALDSMVQGGANFTNPVLLSLLLHTTIFDDPQLWSGQRGNPPDVWRFISSSWRTTSKTVRISRRDMERIAQILISYRKLVQSIEHRRLLSTLVSKPYLSEALDFFEVDLKSMDKPTDFLAEWRRVAPRPPPPEPRYRCVPERDTDGHRGDEDLGPPALDGDGEVSLAARPRRKHKRRRRSRSRQKSPRSRDRSTEGSPRPAGERRQGHQPPSPGPTAS